MSVLQGCALIGIMFLYMHCSTAHTYGGKYDIQCAGFDCLLLLVAC